MGHLEERGCYSGKQAGHIKNRWRIEESQKKQIVALFCFMIFFFRIPSSLPHAIKLTVLDFFGSIYLYALFYFNMEL